MTVRHTHSDGIKTSSRTDAVVGLFARQDQTPDRLIFQTMGHMAIDDAPKWTDHLDNEIRAAIDVPGQAVDDAQEAQAA